MDLDIMQEGVAAYDQTHAEAIELLRAAGRDKCWVVLVATPAGDGTAHVAIRSGNMKPVNFVDAANAIADCGARARVVSQS